MPGEMQSFVLNTTDYQAITRVGGDLQTIKNLLAAGFPVVIEKGYDPPDDDWMGHYLTLNGYDDAQAIFTAQDSLIMPDFPLPYDLVEQRWRDFNHIFLVIYPPERTAELASILGPHYDEAANIEYAVQKARQEIEELAGRDLYFAWFNLGTAYDKLGRFPDVVRELEAVLELDPQYADALNYLGYTYADMGIHLEEAETRCQRIVIIDHGRTIASGTLDEIQRRFRDEGWTDGLPVIPPTRDAVEQFLAPRRDLDEQVAPRLTLQETAILN